MTLANSTPTWRWLVAVLIVMLGWFAVNTYATVTNRITDLEIDRKASLVMLGELKTEVALLRQSVETSNRKLDILLDSRK